MKKNLFFLILVASIMVLNAQELYVGTYNIRNQNNYDVSNGNDWVVRHKVICNQINFEQPDIFGTQEALFGQINDMLTSLDGYQYIGIAREDGKFEGEHSAIFYKADRIELVENGDFWISETPEKPSKGWDAACVRICTWGKFMEKTSNKIFYFFNLHMDHVGVMARREGAKLVVSQIKKIASTYPVILTGDFNVDQENEIFSIFKQEGGLKDSYEEARIRFIENGTFNSFDPELKTSSRIDHVLLSTDWEVDRYGVLTNVYWIENTNTERQKGHDAPSEIDFKKHKIKCPSDHYPVMVRIKCIE